MNIQIVVSKKLYYYIGIMIISLCLTISGGISLYKLDNIGNDFSVDMVDEGQYYYINVDKEKLMGKFNGKEYQVLYGGVGFKSNHIYMYFTKGKKQYIGLIVPEAYTKEFSHDIDKGEEKRWLVKAKKDKHGYVLASKNTYTKYLQEPTESYFKKVVEYRKILEIVSYDEERFVSQQKIMLFPIAFMLFFLFFVRRTD